MTDHPLSSLLDSVPMGMVVIGMDGRVELANDRARDIFGSGMRGRHYITVLRQPTLLDTIEAVAKDEKDRTTRYLGRKDGRDTTYQVSCSAITWPNNQRGISVTFDDITEIETAGQMRRDFVANVSHELRTPLTAMSGFIETLRGAAKDDPKARDRFLGIMEREAGRMNRLVDDLLSLSRVEAQERQRPTTTIDARALAESCLGTLEPKAAELSVQLKLDQIGTNFDVLADADQLRQVLNNLIENAIKYGRPDSTVTVAVAEVSNEPSIRGTGVRIDVTDQGEGISDLHLARLTERFYRIDNHRSREMGGTGLGLAIVKHIINRHRGRLRISSKTGEGSVFSVILPRD